MKIAATAGMIILSAAALYGGCSGKQLAQPDGGGGRGGAVGDGGGSSGGGSGGAGGCRFGFAGNNGAAGIGGGSGGAGAGDACATFSCGSGTCRLGEQYCFFVFVPGGAGAPGTGGAGGAPSDPHYCLPIPTTCADNPTCACVRDNTSWSCICGDDAGIGRIDCVGV